MKEDFQKKLLADIERTGFPLELELIEKLRFHGHMVYPNISFTTDENNIKELDIVASIKDAEKEWKRGPVEIQVLFECKKKANNPWVFFDEGNNPINQLLGLIGHTDYSTDFISMNGAFNPIVGWGNTAFANHHHNDDRIPVAKTYYEAFKERHGEPTGIFKAAMNVFHGRKFLKDLFGKSWDKKNMKQRTMLQQYCIVLDGTLVLAKRERETFALKEVDHLMLSAIDTISPVGHMLTGHEIIIDVIRKEYFDKYLAILKKEIRDFCYHLKRVDESGWQKDLLPQQA